MEIEDGPEDNGKPFKCSKCPSTFTQRGNLLRHISTIHEGKKRTDVPNSKFTEESYDIEGNLNLALFIQGPLKKWTEHSQELHLLKIHRPVFSTT